MTSTPKLLFDECLPRPIVENHLVDSLRLFGAVAEIAHLLSHFPQGTPDNEWIPAVANDGWVVVTSDGGKQSKKSEKLPLICRECGVTHVILSRTIHRMRAFEKCHAITGLWRELLDAAEATAGTHFSLQMTHSGIVVLRKIWEPPSGSDVPRQQANFLE